MATVTIYGASDGLIEVEGDISEEFNPTSRFSDDDECDGGLLVFSDGTVLNVAYTEEGVWRITPIAKGSARMEKVEAVSGDDDNYSDRVTLTGDLKWVVFGETFVAAKKEAQ